MQLLQCRRATPRNKLACWDRVRLRVPFATQRLNRRPRQRDWSQRPFAVVRDMLLELFMCTADSAVLLAEVAEEQQLLKALVTSSKVCPWPRLAFTIM